ncbi:small nuclear RNA activating complex, subunit SNAP43-domain-containing protein [Radiomyces spectabilis]|uniref:small nuclear RNA activating complex, subunit SNAP43-domain-containing protein n=1 Tax=Radiomyces spectabilis TaxID=64574 RepID=UPI00221F44DF|nr:small nuclear RNA activating complex, subunit SNAP43-domain-containing protein [Radiomyces spectabilis]KAI8377898.1 small nuclear RNA activating complex, subunit SNAP43-domain-containing protein [Radiomyces spectabilis]
MPRSKLNAFAVVPIGRGRLGLAKQAITHDVELLLTTFVAESTHNFRSFGKVWKELNFGYIHFACLEKENRTVFMHTIYDAVLEYLTSDNELFRIATIFALYSLYFSQPVAYERIRIRVDNALWIELHNYFMTCARQKENWSVAVLFKRLKDEGAFCLVAIRQLETPSYFLQLESKQASDVLEEFQEIKRNRFRQDISTPCSNAVSSRFEELAKQYQQAKNLACATPQATVATQQWLKTSLNVEETNPRLLRNVFLNNSLATDETEFPNELKKANHDIWTARVKRLRQQ